MQHNFLKTNIPSESGKPNLIEVKPNPSLSWAWPSSAPACLLFFSCTHFWNCPSGVIQICPGWLEIRLKNNIPINRPCFCEWFSFIFVLKLSVIMPTTRTKRDAEEPLLSLSLVKRRKIVKSVRNTEKIGAWMHYEV